MSSLYNVPSYDLIHTDCPHTQTTARRRKTSTTLHHHHQHHHHHQSMNHRQSDVQTHSISTAKQRKCASHDKSVVKRGRRLDKSSDFLRWHKTKLKAVNKSGGGEGSMMHRIFFILTIVVFASLSDILICVAHAGDVSSLIRVSDDDINNQKYSELGITTEPLAREGGAAATNGRNNNNNPPGYNLDKFGSNLELSIAAVFNKVAYGTTTKRSISDVFVPNLTTVPTPQLTTFR